MVNGGACVVVNATMVGRWPTGFAVWTVEVVRALSRLGERLAVHTADRDQFRGLNVEMYPAPRQVRPDSGVLSHFARLVWIQAGLRRWVARGQAAALLNPVHEGVFWPSVPQVTTVHDVLPLHFRREYPRLYPYFRYCLPVLLRHSQAVLTVSEASKRDLVREYGLAEWRVHVAGAGYDPVRFRPDGPGMALGEPYALYIGNLWPHKNLERMVAAFAAAARTRRSLLVIRGRGRRQHREALNRKIRECGIEARVDWKPYADPDELPRLYRGARMLLLPSLGEGFGLTALEAMACGTPVVGSNTASLLEVVGDAGLLVDPYDTQALAAAMTRVFGDDALAQDLRERALARAQQFSWDATAVRVQGAIQAAQRRAGGSPASR